MAALSQQEIADNPAMIDNLNRILDKTFFLIPSPMYGSWENFVG